MGIRTSLATLKRYSSVYGWQARLAEIEIEGRRREREQNVESVIAMHARHTQLARAMQGAGGTALQRLMGSDIRLTGLKPADIARLIDLGLRAERHALGASTDRREIGVDVWNDVVLSVVDLFREINDEPDATTRARLFARRLDDLVSQRLDALKQHERE